MNLHGRFILSMMLLGLLMTGPFCLTAVVLYADATEAERAALTALLAPRLPLGLLITALGLVAGVAVLRHLFRYYVLGLRRIAEQLRLMLGANRSFRVAAEGPLELRELARAVNDLAQQRDGLLSDVMAQIEIAKASVEEEKNRLAALMSELALGVVVCNLDGRILLYNNRARLQFGALSRGPSSMNGGALIGLGRSIFSILEPAQVSHALDSIQHRLTGGNSQPTTNFITATKSGQLLRAQVAPVLVAGSANTPHSPHPGLIGYVITVDNITHSFEREAQRDEVLHSLTAGSRSALANIRAAVETLMDNPEMDAAYRERFTQVIAEESTTLSRRLDDVMNRFADSLKTRWPLEDVLAVDVLAAAARRIDALLSLPVKHEELDETLWLRVDSFALIQAIVFLAARLQDQYAIRELRLRVTTDDRMGRIDLIWSGALVASEAIYLWENEPMTIGTESSLLSLRDVIDRHSGEIWYERDKAAHRAYFRIVLPRATMLDTPDSPSEGTTAQAAHPSRPEYYDFDLFAARDAKAAGFDPDARLSVLAYTVFDTETSGLEPANGDEIIQIGAVRIINSRLLRQEVFDQLVDPLILLKAQGVAIHGITQERVNGQPTLDLVLPAFHEFCAETVLVAHNAAFDMRFLQVKEASLGVRFSQPVLDTLLLSAVIHPHQESHQLEHIAERLGITLVGRHTALGDAMATAEIFLKMIPLLAAMGIHTLQQALAAARQTSYARISY